MNAFTAILALASTASAHMLLRNPVPAFVVTNGPLEADGSNFPCKIAGGSGSIPTTNKNSIAIGSPVELSFTGGATHGGGSCQVSFAKGLTVSKDTKWMVVHSIEGGCPSDNAGNLNGDAASTASSKFSFTVPDHPDLGAGDYTMAWTWHNKIGNREMYMNCAYVALSGGSASKKRYMPSSMQVSKRASASLPDMFVANIGGQCATTEGVDVQYPNPGSSVETGSLAKLGPPVGSGCGSAGNSVQPPVAGPGKSSAAAAIPSSTANVVQPAQPSNSAGAGRPGGQRTQTEGGSFATVAPVAGGSSSAVATSVPSASAAAPVASVPVAAPVASSPAAASSVASPPIATGTAGSGSSSESTTAGVECGNEGEWACAADGKSFQRCASQRWSVSIPMSNGLACVPGISMDFSYNTSGTKAKRDLRSHIARRQHNVHGSFNS